MKGNICDGEKTKKVSTTRFFFQHPVKRDCCSGLRDPKMLDLLYARVETLFISVEVGGSKHPGECFRKPRKQISLMGTIAQEVKLSIGRIR